MAPSAMDEQRRKEDLELLALFDADAPQDLSGYESTYGISSATPEPTPSTSSEVSATDENEQVDVYAWVESMDELAVIYIDNIIAADEARREEAARAQAEEVPPPSPTITVNPDDDMFTAPCNYKCPMCTKKFNSKSAMRQHGRRHILKLLKCHCGFRGQSPVLLRKHYLYHHVGMPKQKFLASF